MAVRSNVLQNGDPRWSAATDIAQLIEPPPGKLRDYKPQLRYLLLDEGAIDESAPLALRNLTAALLRLEKSRDSSNVSARKQIAPPPRAISWVSPAYLYANSKHHRVRRTRRPSGQVPALNGCRTAGAWRRQHPSR